MRVCDCVSLWVYPCACQYVCVSPFVYVHCTCAAVCARVSRYITRVSVLVCVRINTRVSVQKCVCFIMYDSIRVHQYVRVRMCVSIFGNKYLSMRRQNVLNVCLNMCVTCSNVCVYIGMCIYVCMCVCVCVHVFVYMYL